MERESLRQELNGKQLTPSFSFSMRIFFSATSFPVVLHRALNTSLNNEYKSDFVMEGMCLWNRNDDLPKRSLPDLQNLLVVGHVVEVWELESVNVA